MGLSIKRAAMLKTYGILIILLNRAIIGWGCPSVCTCDNILYEVRCVGRGLSSIPSNLPSETKSLILQYNNIVFTQTSSNTTFQTSVEVEVLDLSWNKIEGIPEGLLDPLTDLVELHLENNDISSINWKMFYTLRNLKRLYLNWNRISRIQLSVSVDTPPQSLGLHLEILHLNNNKLDTLENNTFSAISSIDSLFLQNNLIETIDESAFNGTEVRYLNLGANKLTPDNLNLTGVSGLQVLVVYSNMLTLDNSDFLSGLTSLRVLSMSHNHVTTISKNSFRDLVNLKELYLEGNNVIIDSLLDEISNITDLVALGLSSDTLVDFPYWLCDLYKNLSVVHITHSNISSITRELSTKCTNLQTINLKLNQISYIEPMAFANISFRYLHLQMNQIQTIPENTFNTGADLPGFEMEVYLDLNPLICDCHLGHILALPDVYEVTGKCAEPLDMAGTKLSTLNEADFICQTTTVTEEPTTTIADTTTVITTTKMGEPTTVMDSTTVLDTTTASVTTHKDNPTTMMSTSEDYITTSEEPDTTQTTEFMTTVNDATTGHSTMPMTTQVPTTLPQSTIHVTTILDTTTKHSTPESFITSHVANTTLDQSTTLESTNLTLGQTSETTSFMVTSTDDPLAGNETTDSKSLFTIVYTNLSGTKEIIDYTSPQTISETQQTTDNNSTVSTMPSNEHTSHHDHTTSKPAITSTSHKVVESVSTTSSDIDNLSSFYSSSSSKLEHSIQTTPVTDNSNVTTMSESATLDQSTLVIADETSMAAKDYGSTVSISSTQNTISEVDSTSNETVTSHSFTTMSAPSNRTTTMVGHHSTDKTESNMSETMPYKEITTYSKEIPLEQTTLSFSQNSSTTYSERLTTQLDRNTSHWETEATDTPKLQTVVISDPSWKWAAYLAGGLFAALLLLVLVAAICFYQSRRPTPDKATKTNGQHSHTGQNGLINGHVKKNGEQATIYIMEDDQVKIPTLKKNSSFTVERQSSVGSNNNSVPEVHSNGHTETHPKPESDVTISNGDSNIEKTGSQKRKQSREELKPLETVDKQMEDFVFVSGVTEKTTHF